jgi:hypothetical protein
MAAKQPSIWAAFDAKSRLHSLAPTGRCCRRHPACATVINGVNQNNAQQNSTLGSEANVSLNSRNSLVFQFAKVLVHQNGPSLTGFAVKYTYSWGRGYK